MMTKEKILKNQKKVINELRNIADRLEEIYNGTKLNEDSRIAFFDLIFGIGAEKINNRSKRLGADYRNYVYEQSFEDQKNFISKLFNNK